MNNVNLSNTLQATVPAWKRENATVEASPVPMVRELNELIADIRRARAVLDAAGLTDEPVRLEHVISNDPRD